MNKITNIKQIVEILEQYSATIQAIFTIVLIVVTAFYAWQTYRSNLLIRKQVLPKISLSIIKMTTNLVSDNFVNKLKNAIDKKEKGLFNIEFTVTYLIDNYSSAFGSINRPVLKIRSKNKINIKITPPLDRNTHVNYFKWNDSSSEKLAQKRLSQISRESESSIYIRPRERKTVEEKYIYFLDASNPTEESVTLIEEYRVGRLKYIIEYLNEQGKIVNKKIDINKIDNGSKDYWL